MINFGKKGGSGSGGSGSDGGGSGSGSGWKIGASTSLGQTTVEILQFKLYCSDKTNNMEQYGMAKNNCNFT